MKIHKNEINASVNANQGKNNKRNAFGKFALLLAVAMFFSACATQPTRIEQLETNVKNLEQKVLRTEEKINELRDAVFKDCEDNERELKKLEQSDKLEKKAQATRLRELQKKRDFCREFYNRIVSYSLDDLSKIVAAEGYDARKVAEMQTAARKEVEYVIDRFYFAEITYEGIKVNYKGVAVFFSFSDLLRMDLNPRKIDEETKKYLYSKMAPVLAKIASEIASRYGISMASAESSVAYEFRRNIAAIVKFLGSKKPHCENKYY